MVFLVFLKKRGMVKNIVNHCVYRVTPEDVAQLRTLMMGCVSVAREAGQIAASQSQTLASKLDKALQHMTQLTKQ